MTVSTTIIKSFGTGDGSTATFAYQFKIIQDSDLEVFIRTNSTGAESAAKVLGTDYSMTGAGVATGGTVTFLTGKIPISGQTIVLRRNVPKTQVIDYIANDPFPAETHEEGLDRGIMVAQQNFEEVERSIKLSKTNTMTSTEFKVGATERANKVLSFDSTGELSVTQELGTFKGSSATTTTAAYAIRDIVKGTTAAQLNNIYICIQASPIGTALTNTAYWVLLVDAVSAATSATAAAASASAASTSATAATNNGAAQVTLATAQVALAATQATNSANSATTSGNSATASGNSATASANSATAAAASADAFDDIYLGTKSSDPTTDNDGDALAAGMLYFNSQTDLLRVYTGSAWQNAAVDTTGFITISGTQTLTNKTLTAPKIGTSILDTNGNELALLTATSSAVNEFTIANAATNNAPRLSATGETNVDLDLLAKGTGHVTIRGNNNVGTLQFNCESNTHGQQLKPQPHSVGSSAVHTLPNITGDLIAGKIEGTNFTDSLLVGHATTGTLDAASNNTGVGIAALDTITSGDSNTAVGTNAGTALTTGGSNTFVGKGSGQALSNANNNVYIGEASGFYNTATGNTGIGKSSLQGSNGASSGYENCALGQSALNKVTSGDQNIGLGKDSGFNINTGNKNITIGYQSGDNITSGDGNVIIGSINADSATADKQLIVADGVDGSVAWLKGDSNGQVKLTSGYIAEVALTDASTITWNAATQPVAKVTLGASRTMGLPANPVSGQFISLLIIQDGTGSRTISWNAAYEFALDTAPTLTATANLGDLFTFRYNGAKWLEVGRNLALTLS